jgi:hypothetical protein
MIGRLIEDGIFLEVVRDGAVESLALQPLLGEESALVSVCAVSEDGDNCRTWLGHQYDFDTIEGETLTFAQLLCEFKRANNIEGGTRSKVDTLGVQKFVKNGDSLLVGYGESTINLLDEGRHVVCDTTLANTFIDASIIVQNPVGR